MLRLKHTCKFDKEDPSTKKAAQLSSERTHSYTTIYCTHTQTFIPTQTEKKTMTTPFGID